MQFSIIALLAVATGALAVPGKPPKPEKPAPPTKINIQTCGDSQSPYCCNGDGHGEEVKCVSLSNGGVGGVCNGIQMCCNNNEGSQSCGFAIGGGVIIIGDGKKGW